MPLISNIRMTRQTAVEANNLPTTMTASPLAMNSMLENTSVPKMICRIVPMEVNHEKRMNELVSGCSVSCALEWWAHRLNSSWKRFLIAVFGFSALRKVSFMRRAIAVVPNIWMTIASTTHIDGRNWVAGAKLMTVNSVSCQVVCATLARAAQVRMY